MMQGYYRKPEETAKAFDADGWFHTGDMACFRADGHLEVAVAFVIRVADATIDAEALVAACRGRIASFKIPRHVVFVDTLPMTASGKVQKAKLRERALELLWPAP